MAKKPVKAIGIDIGSSSIKMAEASFNGGQYTIDRAVVLELDNGVWQDGIPEEIDVASIHLRRALKALGSHTKHVVMSVPTSALMVRNVPMESSLRGDELWRTVAANLPQYIPFSAEEVMMDFQVMGSSSGVANHNDVLITAVEREFVLQREVLADMASVKATAVDGDIYALLKLIGQIENLNQYTDYDAIAVIEIGLHRSGLHVVLGDGSIYVREFPVGGEQLTENIADNLNIGFDEAETRKCSNNWNDEEMVAIKEQFLNQIGEQALSAIEVYLPNNPQVELKKVYVSGASIGLPNIAEHLSSSMGYDVAVLDPTKILTFSDRVTANDFQRTSLGIACGLAIRSVG